MTNVTDHKGISYKNTSEMCRHYGIKPDTFMYRIKNGWTVEDALTIEASNSRCVKKCKDHLGNEYRSIKEMCEAYEISENIYSSRIRSGWSLKDALTKEIAINNQKKCKDHLGNEYNSICEMLEHYGISRKLFNRRISDGYTLEEALTMKNGESRIEKEYLDHLGNRYRSKAEMCKHYGIKVEVYDGRIKNGWNKKDALEKRNRNEQSSTDHLGNKYEDTRSMCKAYNISYEAYRDRLRRGKSKEEALSTPSIGRYKICKDHLGNKYSSEKEMCDAYGIGHSLYYARVKNGWDTERALTTEVRTRVTIVDVHDHLGNKFNGIGEMCKAYGMSKDTYQSRLRRGWSIEKALTTPLQMNSKYKVGKEAWRTDSDIYYECNEIETNTKKFIKYSELLEAQKQDLYNKERTDEQKEV